MFVVIKKGGLIGESKTPKAFPTREEAKVYAELWKKSYSSAARKYYNVHYTIKEIKKW